MVLESLIHKSNPNLKKIMKTAVSVLILIGILLWRFTTSHVPFSFFAVLVSVLLLLGMS